MSCCNENYRDLKKGDFKQVILSWKRLRERKRNREIKAHSAMVFRVKVDCWVYPFVQEYGVVRDPPLPKQIAGVVA